MKEKPVIVGPAEDVNFQQEATELLTPNGWVPPASGEFQSMKSIRSPNLLTTPGVAQSTRVNSRNYVSPARPSMSPARPSMLGTGPIGASFASPHLSDLQERTQVWDEELDMIFSDIEYLNDSVKDLLDVMTDEDDDPTPRQIKYAKKSMGRMLKQSE